MKQELQAFAPDLRKETQPAFTEMKAHFQHLHGILQVREQALEQMIIDTVKAGLDPYTNLVGSVVEVT